MYTRPFPGHSGKPRGIISAAAGPFPARSAQHPISCAMPSAAAGQLPASGPHLLPCWVDRAGPTGLPVPFNFRAMTKGDLRAGLPSAAVASGAALTTSPQRPSMATTPHDPLPGQHRAQSAPRARPAALPRRTQLAEAAKSPRPHRWTARPSSLGRPGLAGGTVAEPPQGPPGAIPAIHANRPGRCPGLAQQDGSPGSQESSRGWVDHDAPFLRAADAGAKAKARSAFLQGYQEGLDSV